MRPPPTWSLSQKAFLLTNTVPRAAGVLKVSPLTFQDPMFSKQEGFTRFWPGGATSQKTLILALGSQAPRLLGDPMGPLPGALSQ